MARFGAQPFRGTDRFELTGHLGEGGMGIVYRAVDRERDVEVALKTLHNVSAAAIFRFKQEFRALADVAHPNLITLHELFCEQEQWFFTMELIDGVDLLTHVCGQPLDDRGEHATHHATVPDRGQATPPTRRVGIDDTLAPGDAPRAGVAPARGRPLIGRLRQALPQLAAGVIALHESGHLHQDIKPSNIMVTLAGRVVLMDFGVVAELGGHGGDAAGTPAYMAPERVRDATATPASDWYSVGVVLYYALAGRLPFAGTTEQILADKLRSQPAPLRLQRPEVPEDLDRLCMDLLQADPARRPTGAEVLRRLGAAEEGADRRGAAVAAASAPAASSLAADELALVGRQAHLDALRGALARARTGAGAAVLVHGTSGMGKSALVRAFLEEVRVDRGAVVLAGRCYERESVPYSAVDTVIDALCQHLLALPAAELAELVPEDAALLATLFPVLRRVAGIGEELADEDVASRPHELRRRAFAALRAMLVRIAERRPLVLLIDDLQWGDADSAPLLDVITRAPGAPAMLLLGCYRTDEEQRSELLRASFWRDGRRDMEWLAVGALEPAQARELALTLLGAGDDAAEAVALESGGSPFFIQELVRYRSAGGGDIPSLDVVIRARLDRLGDDARRSVELLAVAGRPLAQRVARTAAGVAEADWPILVQLLGTNRLVRVSGRRGDDLIECYHDRIRETLTARIPPTELSSLHRRLALSLEETARVDPEMMAHHFEAAGDPALAARYALQAADLAAAALAFDRAASLYRRALALRPGGVDEHDLQLRLAAALVNGGRGAEAARIYLDAAAGSDAGAGLELRRLAAEQLLRSGHVDQGLAVLAEVLGEVGLSLPASAARSIPSLLWRRLRLRLRGLDPARAPRMAPGDLAVLEICRSASLGLALFDPVRSATFSTRHLHLALDSGDLSRISFALAIEAGYMASEREPVRANQLLGRAEAIAHALGHPVLHGCVAVIRAIMSYERGDFREAFEGCERAENLLRDHLTGMAWELRTVQMFSLHSLFFLGDMQAMIQRTAQYIADARERGDLYAIMNIRSLAGSCVHAIISDDPARALAEIAEVEGQFPGSGFYVQHMFLLYARTFVDLYQGRADAAYQRLVDARPQVRASLLLHDRGVRTFFHFLLGASAAGAIRHRPGERGRLRRVALRSARVLWRDGATPYRGMAGLVRAAVAAVDQDPAGATGHLRAAIEDFDRAGMTLFSAAAQRRLGQLQGTAEGAELAARIDAGLRASLVAAPEKSIRILTPGFPDDPPILPAAR